MALIQIDKLSRDYGKGRGIFDLSFSIEEGEAFGFLGPNGAGKTTTIRHLMGFLRPQSGRCLIRGLDCWKDREKIQEKLAYIPGEMNFFNDLSGSEFLAFIARYRGLRGATREQEMLERFELDPGVKIRRMSKGTRQKLGLVCAFLHDPEILLLDEPSSGLDPLMQKRFIDLLAEEKKRGKTILLSSHIFEEVERSCSRIAMIREGRLAAVDAVENLRARHLRSYTVHLASEEEALAFARDFEGSASGNEVRLAAKESLESIFMHYYGGNEHAESDTI